MTTIERLCEARLVIGVDDNHRPHRVVVMTPGQRMLAQVSIAEVRRVLAQYDQLGGEKQVAKCPAERGGTEEKSGDE